MVAPKKKQKVGNQVMLIRWKRYLTKTVNKVNAGMMRGQCVTTNLSEQMGPITEDVIV